MKSSFEFPSLATSNEGDCVGKGAQSRYFELFWPHTKFPLNAKKLENNSLIG